MTSNDIAASGEVADVLLTFLSRSATPEQSAAALSIALGRVCERFHIDLKMAVLLMETAFTASKEIDDE